MKTFELATDECLLVLDKIGHDEEHRLYQQTQKQFVLIYNECSLQCLQTGYYDDAIELLNRAIGQEKTSAELYINRGGRWQSTMRASTSRLSLTPFRLFYCSRAGHVCSARLRTSA